MKILLSGSHGLIGNALARSFENRGDSVWSLVRGAPHSPDELGWPPAASELQPAKFEGFDLLIHLAGEPIAGRWTPEKKQRIRSSRVQGTLDLVRMLSKLKHPPAHFFCASAVGFYGNREDELLTESSAPGESFLAETCVEWENAAAAAFAFGVRVVHMRFGMVLSKEGGALPQMLRPASLGLGGSIGSGGQWWSWIALPDVVRAVHFLVQHRSLSGPVNFAAPHPVRNREFARTLGRIMRRPTLFSLPAFAVKFLLGEMGEELLLSSARVVPDKLVNSGFRFEFPQLDSALGAVLEPEAA